MAAPVAAPVAARPETEGDRKWRCRLLLIGPLPTATDVIESQMPSADYYRHYRRPFPAFHYPFDSMGNSIDMFLLSIIIDDILLPLPPPPPPLRRKTQSDMMINKYDSVRNDEIREEELWPVVEKKSR